MRRIKDLRVLLLALGLVLGLAVAGLSRAGAGNPPVDNQRTLAPLCSLWNATAGVSSAGVVSGGFTPSQEASLARIGVVLANTGPLYITESDGVTTQTFALNGGTNLAGFQAYTFVWPLRQHNPAGAVLTYNFVLGVSQNGAIPVLRADECLFGVD